MPVKTFLRYLLSLLFFGMVSLSGLELPAIIPSGAAPEIIDFTLYRPDSNTEGAYALVWDTKNATKITISTIGEVAASGKHIVKNPEPGVEEIVLSVSNGDDFQAVTKTVYVKQPPSMGKREIREDRTMDDDYFPVSPMRQRGVVPRRYRYY